MEMMMMGKEKKMAAKSLAESKLLQTRENPYFPVTVCVP